MSWRVSGFDCWRLVSPGTTRFHRRPDSVSYFVGKTASSARELSERGDAYPEVKESKSSLYVDGRCDSVVTTPENWP